jgi:lysyl-tRNA synthetase class 2
VFRNGERGRRHNPEFSLLEWYRPGIDHHQMMDDVSALLSGLLSETRAEERISYRELFLRRLDIDPLTASPEVLRQCAVACSIPGAASLELPSRDAWLDLLLCQHIEPELGRGRLTYVYDYPASQAALARIRCDDLRPPWPGSDVTTRPWRSVSSSIWKAWRSPTVFTN